MGGLLFYSSFIILPAQQWIFQKTKQKNKNWKHTSFFGKPPELSRYVTLPLAIPEKTRLLLGISVMWSCINYTPWKFQNQKPRLLEITVFFLMTSGKFTSYLEIPFSTSSIPLEISCPPTSPLLVFFPGTNSKHFLRLVTKVTFLKWKAKTLGKLADLHCKRNRHSNPLTTNLRLIQKRIHLVLHSRLSCLHLLCHRVKTI